MYYLGIDPGLSGALAFYDPKTDDLQIFDMPIHTGKSAKGKNKRTIDIYGLGRIVESMAEKVSMAVVEDVHAIPGAGSTSASFSFGFAAGCAQMAVAGCAIPMTLIRSGDWKRAMRLSSDKEASRREASKLMPKHADLWSRVKDDGRAEATLLAYYAAKHKPQGVAY